MSKSRLPFVLTLATLGLALSAHASDDLRPTGAPVPTTSTTTEPAPNANTRDLAIRKGIDWLKQQQHSDGGWGAGSWGADNLSAPADVATTAYATLALFRDAKGTDKHRAQIEKGVTFVVNAIKTAPEGPRLNTPTGTQPQYKMGELVDTHFAALLLGEVDGKLSPAVNREVHVWYDMALSKVQLAQNSDGSFDQNGWAPILSSSVAAQSLYTAKVKGKDINEEVLTRSDNYTSGLVTTDAVDASAGAGVELYSVASAVRVNDQTAKREAAGGNGGSQAAADAQTTAAAAVTRIAGDDDGSLMAGFGSIGGEEMLSYQMITDTLAEGGGENWTKWDGRITRYLVGIQNSNGTWTGHHCITSTVFTTAGAVMTLTAGDYLHAKAPTALRN